LPEERIDLLQSSYVQPKLHNESKIMSLS